MQHTLAESSRLRHAADRLRVAVLAAILATTPCVARAGDSTFHLGPEDHVRLKVLEWRASQDVIFEWKALNDEFIVSAGGTLPVPFVGDIQAAGRTPEEVGHLIADRLAARVGISVPPDVSVNVIKYRPFYVAGDVVHPGPYPYQPGLTVLQAVATAGGVNRPGDLGLVRLSREVIEGEGDLSSLSHDFTSLLLRRSRLQAELADATAFSLPASLEPHKSEPLVNRVLQDETQIFAARRQAFVTQTAALNDLKAFLDKETESLRAQLATVDTQMQLVNKELGSVTSLVEKGMVIAPRQLALQRSVAQIQGDRLNMQTSVLRVQAEISRANIALIDLRNNRATEVSFELRDTKLRMDELTNKSDTRERLLYEARVTAPRMLNGRQKRGQIQPTYSLIRLKDGVSSETPISDLAEIEPGDSVRVTMPLPDSMIEDPDTPIASGLSDASRPGTEPSNN